MRVSAGEQSYSKVMVVGAAFTMINKSLPLPHAATSRVDRAFEDYYSTDFGDDRTVLIAGEQCGAFNLEGRIDQGENSLAAYAIRQYQHVKAPPVKLLLGADVADIEQMLTATRDMQPGFFQGIKDNQEKLKVVSDRDQFDAIVKYGGKALDLFAGQFIYMRPRVPLRMRMPAKKATPKKIALTPLRVVNSSQSAADE